MSRINFLLSLVFLGAVLPGFAQAPQTESLGQVARELREAKTKDARKAVKVYTNDNLPPPDPLAAVSQSAPIPEEHPADPGPAASKPADHSAPDAGAGQQSKAAEDKARTRDYWQGRFTAARRELAKAAQREQLAEDEFSLLQIQQVRELNSATKADLTAQMEAKQSELDLQKSATDAAQMALDHLEAEFKDSGAPDEWSQTE